MVAQQQLRVRARARARCRFVSRTPTLQATAHAARVRAVCAVVGSRSLPSLLTIAHLCDGIIHHDGYELCYIGRKPVPVPARAVVPELVFEQADNGRSALYRVDMYALAYVVPALVWVGACTHVPELVGVRSLHTCKVEHVGKSPVVPHQNASTDRMMGFRIAQVRGRVRANWSGRANFSLY